MERVQKIIASRRLNSISRRAAEQLIADGRVSVNGNTAKLGDKASEGDVVCIDGVPLPARPEFVYIALNKPRGVVTTMSDPQGRKTVSDLLGRTDLLPVGRLDINSEGLLIMTNDNELINKLTHPRFEVEKEYEVWLKSMDSERIKSMIANNPQARIEIDNNRLTIVLKEGKKREIRLMCADVGLCVDRLKRVRFGGVSVGDLRTGQHRELTREEVSAGRIFPGV